MKLDLYGWFPKENKATIKKLIKENDIKTVIEIGCFLGKSTKFFVEQGCTVKAVDTFKGASDLNRCEKVMKRLPNLRKQFDYNMEILGIRDKVETYEMTSLEANKILGTADLIYIDGSHDYDDVIDDIKAWKGKATKILCGDDYTESHEDVKKAVDELLPNSNRNQRVWFNKQ